MASTPEFIANFDKLEGLTIGERRKNLFLLLNSNKTKANELDFTLLQPKNYLEEKFKVDTLLYFKRVPELIEVIKSEKPILIRRILKGNLWFIENVLCNLSVEDLISLFPHIAFNTKIKIINNLAIFLSDTDKARSYFEAIKNKYGLYLAAKLLPSCDSQFILEFVGNHRFKPSCKQLLTIIVRHPTITEEILDILTNKYDMHDDYDDVFKHIGKHDLDLFIKLNEKFRLRKHLGRRLTHKYVFLHKNDIISDPKMYYSVLHNRQIAKTLNSEFSLLYINYFPKTIANFCDAYPTIFSILRKLPKRMKGVDLFLNTFQQVYNNSFWNYSSFIKLELISMLSPEERRKVVSMENKPEDIDEEQWIPYLTIDKSLPYIKHKISLSSAAKTRARLVKSLVLTCKLNCDTSALLEVCSYVLGKHRNDSRVVRESFLECLETGFELETLSEQHWTIINQLLGVGYVNNEDFRSAFKIKQAYIHYRLLHDLPIKEQVSDWIRCDYQDLIIIKKNLQLSKHCLLLFGDLINELESPVLDIWATRLITNLIEWNKHHSKDYISIFKFRNVFNSIKNKFKQDDYAHRDINILNYCIREEQEERHIYLDIYLSLSCYYANINIPDWLILYDPSLVLRNIDKLTLLLLENYGSFSNFFFFKYARNFTHLDIPKRIINICVDQFEKKKCRNALIGMTYLQDPLEFVKFASQYYPTEKEANYKTEEGREQYALLEVIGKHLKELNPSSVALESILVFCKGDFLKLIRSSLYSISDNVNEIKLVPFFSELLNRAVSIRKHAMHLTFRVLDKMQVYAIIKHFMEKEKNLSLRKFILKICFNFFITNPEDFTWELVTLSLKAVDIDDEEAMDIFTQIDKVPQNYIVRYITLSWDVMHSLSDPNKRESNKATLLRSISKNLIPLIPNEFYEKVITMYFFKGHTTLTFFDSQINTLVCKYIIYCDDPIEQKKRLNSCFAIVKNFIVNNWNSVQTGTSSRNMVIDFLKEFCKPFLENESRDKNIFIDFMNIWNDLFKPHETIDEYLHLLFTEFLIDSYQFNELPSKLEELCNTLVNNYGQLIIGILCAKINFFARYFFKNDEELERLTLIDSLIHTNSSIACLILSIFLLNEIDCSSSDKYNLIIEKLERYSEPVIRLYLCSHFSKNSSLFYKSLS